MSGEEYLARIEERSILALCATTPFETIAKQFDIDPMATRRIGNQGKANAHKLVNRAIRLGELVRPNHCETCQCKCKPIAHHTDYNRPLDVVWLCHPCHERRHHPGL